MKKQGLALWGAALLLAALLCGCSADKENSGADRAPGASYGDSLSDSESYVAEDGVFDSYVDEDLKTEAPSTSGNVATNTSTTRKLIKTVEISMETEAFDSLMTSLNQEVSSRGGYLQSQSLDGGSSDNRYASLVVRIPAKEADAFLSSMGKLGNVYSRQEQVEDVTLTYVDVQSRITALKTEQEALLRLLEQANSLDEIITLQDKLTEVRYELESYESRLRTLNDQIDYATIRLYVHEVERESSAPEKGMWATIGANLSNNFYEVGEGLEALFVGLVSSLPYLLVAAVIAGAVLAVVLLCTRRSRKEAKARKAAAQAAAEQAEKS